MARADLKFVWKELLCLRASVLASSGAAQMGKKKKKKQNVGCLVKPFISKMSELSEVFIAEVCLLTPVNAFPAPCLTFAALPVPRRT